MKEIDEVFTTERTAKQPDLPVPLIDSLVRKLLLLLHLTSDLRKRLTEALLHSERIVCNQNMIVLGCTDRIMPEQF